MTETTWFIIAIILYMALMLAIGYWSYTKTDKYDDYVLADLKLNPFVAAMSAGASDMSAGSSWACPAPCSSRAW